MPRGSSAQPSWSAFPACNVLSGQLDATGWCKTAVGAFQVETRTGGGAVAVAVRPEHLVLDDGTPGLAVRGIVRLVEDLGAEIVVHFDLAGHGSGAVDDIGALVTVLPATAMPEGGLPLNAPLHLRVRPGSLAVFGPSGARIGQGVDAVTSPA